MKNLSALQTSIKIVYRLAAGLLVLSIISEAMKIAGEPESIIDISLSLQMIVRIVGFILFLIWFNKAYHNFYVSNSETATSTPAMAVVSYFIPLINFHKPYMTMTEVYDWSSEHGTTPSDTPIVSIWWGLFLSTAMISTIAMNWIEGIDKDYVFLFVYCLEIWLLFVELTIIARITTWHHDRNSTVSAQ